MSRSTLPIRQPDWKLMGGWWRPRPKAAKSDPLFLTDTLVLLGSCLFHAVRSILCCCVVLPSIPVTDQIPNARTVAGRLVLVSPVATSIPNTSRVLTCVLVRYERTFCNSEHGTTQVLATGFLTWCEQHYVIINCRIFFSCHGRLTRSPTHFLQAPPSSPRQLLAPL